MILPDLNILLYAYDADSPFHEDAKEWLEDTLSGSEPVVLSWHTIIGFLRIGTNPRVFKMPLTITEAIEIVEQWLACPSVKIALPTIIKAICRFGRCRKAIKAFVESRNAARYFAVFHGLCDEQQTQKDKGCLPLSTI